ncbi:hypothetical protein [Arthrobacter sp. M4]|uniref:hypothetical protein n=1 Tax=Arthrobacter sp. M4 TaxID=218160 RepID=UPI001CDBC52E|nr:hypothetical protein [Arthrobacter sp. M4]MCA4132345.1 hypothetical protein [Arthrobacter sp. M4]
MLSLVVAVLATIALGMLVWANDKRHTTYGVALPACLGSAVTAISWTILILAGLGYRPGLSWIPWILPIVLGSAAAFGAAMLLGRRRHKSDVAKLTAALKL